MKVNFQDIRNEEKLVMFSDGEEVVEYFETLFNDLEVFISQS